MFLIKFVILGFVFLINTTSSYAMDFGTPNSIDQWVADLSMDNENLMLFDYLDLDLVQLADPSDVLLDAQYFVPADYGTAHTGIVVFLHGTNGDKDFIKQMNTAPLALLAVENDLAIISIESRSTADPKKWIDNEEEEEIKDAIVAMIADESQLATTDPIYIVGMSNGARFASRVASDYYTLVNAVAQYSHPGVNNYFEDANHPPTRWICGVEDDRADNVECFVNYYRQEFARSGDPEKYIFDNVALDFNDFKVVNGIGVNKSGRILNALKNCDGRTWQGSHDILDASKIQLADPLDVEAEIDDCLAWANITLSDEEHDDFGRVLRVFYSEHAFNGVIDGTLNVNQDTLDFFFVHDDKN